VKTEKRGDLPATVVAPVPRLSAGLPAYGSGSGQLGSGEGRPVQTITQPEAAQTVRQGAGAGRAFDVVAPVVLGVVAWFARWGSLPSDGLWFDDSWVAAGAKLANPGNLLTVGSGHPGFTALLMGIDRLDGGELAYLGVPSLVFGALGPPALYLGLRYFGYERAVSAVVSAALVVAPIPILYSGRVKGYTLDTLAVLLIAVALPLLARRTWRWPMAAAWTVAAVGFGTLSGYTLLATAAAGVILALHPAGDRRVRIVAVSLQVVIQGAYYVVAQSKTDLAGIEEVIDTEYDGHMTFSWNPVTFGRELLAHLRRLAEAFPLSPGDNRWWLALLAVLSIVGLVIASVKGRRSETVAARYLLLVVVLAAGGSLVNRFPFGPSNGTRVEALFSAAGRYTLWMVPALALGLAALAHRAHRWAARRDGVRLALDAGVVLAAIAIIVAGYERAPQAPFPGSESATRFVDASLGPDDVAIVTSTSTFSFAISTTTPVGVQATPDHQVGFAPVYKDPRIKNLGGWAAEPGSPAEIRSWTADVDRVLVMASGPLGGYEDVRVVLEGEGFTLSDRNPFGWDIVAIFQR
jgi:hypothetical protein